MREISQKKSMRHTIKRKFFNISLLYVRLSSDILHKYPCMRHTIHPAHGLNWSSSDILSKYSCLSQPIDWTQSVQISSLSIPAWDSQYTWHPVHWLNTTEQGDQARGAECSSWMAPAPTIDMMKVFHLKQNMNWEREMSCWRQWSYLPYFVSVLRNLRKIIVYNKIDRL